MARIGLILGVTVLTLATIHGPARAESDQADAQEAASAANCPPGTPQVLRQIVGVHQETDYRIPCGKSTTQAVIVQCRDHQCVVLH